MQCTFQCMLVRLKKLGRYLNLVVACLRIVQLQLTHFLLSVTQDCKYTILLSFFLVESLMRVLIFQALIHYTQYVYVLIVLVIYKYQSALLIPIFFYDFNFNIMLCQDLVYRMKRQNIYEFTKTNTFQLLLLYLFKRVPIVNLSIRNMYVDN